MHSLPGPFESDIDAAKRVKQFFDELDQGVAPPTRGEKRTMAFHQDLETKLSELNLSAKIVKRHEVYSTENPSCLHCKKSVHTYHALKFAVQQCPALTSEVDRRGSATRAQKVSEYRTAILQKEINKHSLSAIQKGQHFVSSLNPFKCKYCQQSVQRSYVKKWMVRKCCSAPDPDASPDTRIKKRLIGKQPAPLLQFH